MNHFFALELPEQIRSEIAAQAEVWRSQLGPFYPYRWVPPQDYHITLQFLGDVSEVAVGRAVEAAQIVAKAQHTFRIRLAPAGGFKSTKRSNAVLWMGVRHDPDLKELAQSLEAAVPHPHWEVQFGEANGRSEKPYKPHITVGRGNFTPEYFGMRLDYEQPFPFWEASQFVLMQTVPQQQRVNGAKSRYNIVHTFPFGNTHS